MNALLKRVIMGVLGLVVTLGWWSIRGGDGGSETVKGIPEKVCEGGAGTMTIDVESSGPARVNVTFSKSGEDGNETESMDAWEKVEAGSHSWTIDLPPNAGGYIDLTAEEPEVGAKLSWVIRINDMVLAEESQTLDQPLEPNYAFGLQHYMDDYSSASVD